MISLLLRIAAIVIFALLAFEVLPPDADPAASFQWLAGGLGLAWASMLPFDSWAGGNRS